MFGDMSAKVQNAVAIILFVLVILVLCFYTYLKCLFHPRTQRQINAYLQSHSLTHYPLDPRVLENIPKFVYFLRSRESPLEDCSICLRAFEEGDEGRVLPKCGHVFHVDCIDTWFNARSMCPLCRSPVLPVDPVAPVIPPVSEPGSSSSSSTVKFPTEASERKSVDLTRIIVQNPRAIEATRSNLVIA